MRGKAAVGVAVMLAAATTMWAQEPPQGPGGPAAGRQRPPMGAEMGMMRGRIIQWLAMDPKAAEELGLSADQVQKLKDKVEALKGPREELMQKLRAAEEKQRQLMEAESLDETALLAGADELGQMRTESTKLDIQAMVAVGTILTAEQATKLKENARERMQAATDRWREQRRARPEGTPPPPPEAATPPAPQN